MLISLRYTAPGISIDNGYVLSNEVPHEFLPKTKVELY